MLRLWIRADGTVAQANVLREVSTRHAQELTPDNPYSGAFQSAALDAVRSWRFTPAMKDGKAVDVWVVVPIRFRHNRS